jgi:hypothetical protein
VFITGQPDYLEKESVRDMTGSLPRLWVAARPVPAARGAGQAVGSAGSGGAVRLMT